VGCQMPTGIQMNYPEFPRVLGVYLVIIFK